MRHRTRSRLRVFSVPLLREPLMPRRSARSAHLVAHLPTLPPRLALEAGDDVPRVADVLEPIEEGLDCNLRLSSGSWPLLVK